MTVDFSKIQQEYKNLEYSSFKVSCIKKAIEIAEKEKNAYWELKFRWDYIHQITFYDDPFLAMLAFPEYLSIYDNHPEIHQQYPIKALLWIYKWILIDLSGFYQISYEKAMQYLEDFKRRCIENQYSLRHYYDYLAFFLEDIDEKQYKEARKKYHTQKRDSLSNHKIYELDAEIYFEIYHGSFEKALKLAQPILNGTLRYQDIPCMTYNHFLDYYTIHNDMENATVYEKLLLKEMGKDLADVSTLLYYYALTDVTKGLKMWKKYIILDIKNRYPLDRFNFEKEACFLLKKVKEKRKKNILKMILPKEFLLYKKDNTYNIDELISYYQNNVTELAEKFDKRNRNDNFKKRLNYLNF